MKTVLKIVLVLIAVVVGALATVVIGGEKVVSIFYPTDQLVARIRSSALEATGRELTIGGGIEYTFIPTVQVEVNQVAFANAPGSEPPNMAELERLALEVDPFALLGGSLDVKRFVLTKPVINLEIDVQGRPNWAIGTGEMAPAASESPETSTASGTTGVGDLDGLQVKLGDVRLVDATITYTDKKSGTSERLDNVDMELSLPSLDDPFGAKGGLVWREERIDIDLGTGAPRGLAQGRQTDVTATISGNPINLRFKGNVQLAGAPTAGGELDLDAPSIRGLAAWTGNPLPSDVGGSGLGPLRITGTVGVDGQIYSFNDARIDIDAIKSRGNLTANLSGPKPDVVGRLDVETLDLTPYLPADSGATGGGASGTGTGSGNSGAAARDWSDEPIDMSGLKAANAKFDLTVAGIRLQDIKIGRGDLGIVLKDGLLTINLKELNLYEGLIVGTVAVDASQDTPRIENAVKLMGVQASPLLTDAIEMGWLEGQGDADITIATSGQSQQQMIGNLNGRGGFGFIDGAIIGINIGAMARSAASAFLDSAAGEVQQTDFSELTGTYTIANGVLSNDDLQMLAPLLRVTGAGTVNLKARTVDYRIQPKLVGDLAGQGGSEDSGGITIPIKVSGPWHDPSYTPDFVPNLDKARELIGDTGAKALESAVKDAEGAVKGLVGAGAVEGIAKDLPGGGQSGSSGSESSRRTPNKDEPKAEDLLKNPGKVLEGLGGGLFGN